MKVLINSSLKVVSILPNWRQKINFWYWTFKLWQDTDRPYIVRWLIPASGTDEMHGLTTRWPRKERDLQLEGNLTPANSAFIITLKNIKEILKQNARYIMKTTEDKN